MQRFLTRLVLLLIFMLFFLPGCLSGQSGGEKSAASDAEGGQGQRVQLSGTLRRVGAEPFSHLVLTTEDKVDWYIDAASEQLVSAYEQQHLTLSGIATERELILANGRHIGSRKELHSVELEKSTSPSAVEREGLSPMRAVD